MKINDYILALTSGSLTAPQEKISRLFDDFGQRFELKEIAKPGAVSIGGRGEGSKELNFIEWIQFFRSEGIKDISFYWETDTKASLPSHIAAAFAGGQDFLFRITTQISERTYTLRTILCSQYEIKPGQFVELLDAQDQKDKLWIRAGEMVQEFNKLNDRPAIIMTEVRDYFLGPEVNNIFDMLASQLIKEIQVECKIAGLQLYIPPHLADLFFKSVLLKEDTEWFIQSNKKPWELYFFERLEECLPPKNIKSADRTKKDFNEILLEIAAFADKIKSPFSEAFYLAQYCLSTEIPAGNFDKDHCNLIKASMKKKGFSKRAEENFENIFYYSEDMIKMNWRAERIYGIFAVSIADVFGGMGSWNDQYVETDQDTYQRLSSELFNAMKNYFGILLSVELNASKAEV